MVKPISYMDVLMGKSSLNNPEDYLFVHSHGSLPPRLAKTRAGAGHGFQAAREGFHPAPAIRMGFVSENRGKSQDVNEKIRINHEIWGVPDSEPSQYLSMCLKLDRPKSH